MRSDVAWAGEPLSGFCPLVIVSSYTTFDNLAHGPRGTEATHSMRVFAMDEETGRLTLMTIQRDDVENPAFLRFHPKLNVVYGCTESVLENGRLVAWRVHPSTGALKQVANVDAGGTSTCYITLDRDITKMLVVNYWDSTISVLPVSPEGVPGDVVSQYDPKEGKGMRVKATARVNHSRNDPDAQKQRQMDPHSHAVVLGPCGNMAYVPDLGMDLIRQFLFCAESGKLTPVGAFRSGPEGKSLGPRYMEFHPTLPVVYVVNELSSEVSVFRYHRSQAKAIIANKGVDGASSPATLELWQTISTVPPAFPREMNTCGRITVHSCGRFVLCANRGHDSVAVFRLHPERGGLLSIVSYQHTYGFTPRHFQFDPTGHWLVTANQDSDDVTVFRFNVSSGSLTYTGHKYSVPSPNFVCCVQPHEFRL